jgi:hypothetical protein
MHAGGFFDGSSRVYFADLNMLGYGYTALRVTWEPTADLRHIRVTADAYGYNAYTGRLIKYDDSDAEREFHRQLEALLAFAATRPAQP